MNNHSIIKLLRETSLLLDHKYDRTALRFVEINTREYAIDDFNEFKIDLFEAGSKIKLLFMEQYVPENNLKDFVRASKTKVIAFNLVEGGLQPCLLSVHKNRLLATSLEGEEISNTLFYGVQTGTVLTFIPYPYKNLVSEYAYEGDTEPEAIHPVKRFWRLLLTEKKDILYIAFYSILIGVTSLVLPIGIQNTVELVSGGVFFSSIYVLIAAVILGILFAGILQIVQISLVEHLQRRVFTRAALEFAFRIPRVKMESILNNYAPELVNRFFDVITLQKGLPKFLIDLLAAIFQILFGLLLLSLYHPLFIFFSIALIIVLFLIFFITGPAALQSSIDESKHKYKVVQWLEELARAINSFKLAGNSELPLQKTDGNVTNYLKYRKTHFRLLLTQFWFIVLFKTAITATLLIAGTILVVNREITLGQFVASEVIIIIILNSVEKFITNIDVVYDLLTAVDKVAHVTDLPLEKVGGIDFSKTETRKGYNLELKDLSYQYPDKNKLTLSNINLAIKPGEKICIAGPGNSGKTTLTNLIAGLHAEYQGVLRINNYSLRDLDLRNLRNTIAKNISPEDIFDGTILENLTLGNPQRKIEDVLEAIQRVGLDDDISRLREGLNTHIVSGGKGYSSSFIHKLILARCLVKKPSLMILNDFFSGLKKKEKQELIGAAIHHDSPWTLLAVSNDPQVMAVCDRVIILHDGTIVQEGDFETLIKRGDLSNYID